MIKESRNIKLYRKYAIIRLADLVEGRIDKKYFEKDLKQYRKTFKIKKKKYWE